MCDFRQWNNSRRPSILNFPAVAIRKSTEKIESIEKGNTIITGLENFLFSIVLILLYQIILTLYQRLIMLMMFQIELLKS